MMQAIRTQRRLIHMLLTCLTALMLAISAAYLPTHEVQAATTVVTAMTPTQGPEIQAGYTGGSGFTHPVYNHNPAIRYEDVADDLKLSVKPVSSNTWTDIDNNPASGWIYDVNFGHFWDGEAASGFM